jgi:hypothetical protein
MLYCLIKSPGTDQDQIPCPHEIFKIQIIEKQHKYTIYFQKIKHIIHVPQEGINMQPLTP